MNEYLATRAKVNNWTVAYTCWEKKNHFIQQSDTVYIKHSKTGLMFRSSWPTGNELYSFCLLYVCVYSYLFTLVGYLGGVFCFLGWDVIVVLGFCLLFEEELKLGGGKEGERISKDLEEGRNIVKTYLNLKMF